MIGVASGRLRHVIDIEARTRTKDSVGGSVETWTAIPGLTGIRADIRPIRSYETTDGRKISPLATHMITIRYHAGISHDMRIKFGVRYFYISKIVNPYEARISIEMEAEEKVA